MSDPGRARPWKDRLIALVTVAGLVSGALSGSAYGRPQAVDRLSTMASSFDLKGLERVAQGDGSALERNVATAILASWSGRSNASLIILRRIQPEQLRREAYLEALVARYTAFDLAGTGDYRGAGTAASRYLKLAGETLNRIDREDATEDATTWSLLRHAPRQTTRRRAPSSLPILATPTGRIEAPVSLDGRTTPALFDTGADLSVVSESIAKTFRLRRLPGTIRDVGSTGAASQTRLVMIDRLDIGATSLNHVPAMVEKDSDMILGPTGTARPLGVIIGYPVIRSLGTVSVDRTRTMTIGGRPFRATLQARLVEEGPVVFTLGRLCGKDIAMVFDLGANKTMMNVALKRTCPTTLSGLKAQEGVFSGVGGTARPQEVVLPKMPLVFMRGQLTLISVPVLENASALDVGGTVGNLGRDVASGYRRVMLDFHTMTLRLG